MNLNDDLLLWLAEFTGGFLPCDLVALCRAAALLAVRAAQNAGCEVQVKKEHFQTRGGEVVSFWLLYVVIIVILVGDVACK